MFKRQKDGPSDKKKFATCRTKDQIEVVITYGYSTTIINNRQFKYATDPESTRSIGWRDKLCRQIEEAISYVIKYYYFDMMPAHKNHIERQIKKSLNENYLNNKEPFSNIGLVITAIELVQTEKK